MSGPGMQTVLRGGTSADHPFSFAETPGGLLLLANGIDPVLKWDGLAGRADTAGVLPPTTAPELGGTGLGYITGKLAAYVRFLDADGNPSDLSPVSNLMDAGQDGLIADVNYDRATGVVTVTSPGHGLTGTQAVAIDGVSGLPLVNGRWNVTVADEDTFTVGGLSVTTGAYTAGGVWTMGIATVLYGAVPVPAEAKVVRRQVLRTLAGAADVLYVDIDTTDLATTAFASTAHDATLAAGVPVPLTYGDDDLPYASRNGVPPSHKCVLCSHKGRIFAAADAAYSAGHAEARFNQKAVQGVGTDWRRTFVGRRIYFVGASGSYGIASVNESAQVITLDRPFLDTPRPFHAYTVRPEPGERRLVYYSEAGLPESWPAYNALAIPETDDDISGLSSHGQYLYIFERRHIHRLTNQGDPQDGYVFLAAHRGSINNRTWAEAEGVIYCLDEVGIHKFDGQDSTAISQPVQSLFQGDGTTGLAVDWAADQSLWHAAPDPLRDTIRWFVSMVGYPGLPYALCYNYRTERWWLEAYPTSITASATATLGARRSLAGTDARRVLCLAQGGYDGVDGTGTTRGTVTSASATTLTDTSASFGSLEGAPVAVVEGTGRGQNRIVATATPTTLEVVLPWDVTPDATSVYQVGGIPWQWRSGWFRYVHSEEDEARDVEVVFAPVATPATLDILLYFDHATAPRVWARDLDQDGVRTTAGGPHITVDLDVAAGWARQRLGGHAGTYSFGDEFVSVELGGVQAGAPHRVSQVVLNGVEVA